MTDWLVSLKSEVAAMESTGVYGCPVFEVLRSSGIQVIVANAREARADPVGGVTSMTRSGCSSRMHAYCSVQASGRTRHR